MESKGDSGVPLSSTRQLTPSNKQTISAPAEDDPILRYRKTPVFLLIIYLPTLIIPWVLICVMTRRPLGSPSYYDQTGTHNTNNHAGLIVYQLFKSINAVLAVPIISALLAHGAVVYTTRRRHDQNLNVQQLFALADRGWSNYSLLWSAHSRGRSSLLLWLGALLVLLGAILQPLISVLVTFEDIAVTSCLDVPLGGTGSCSASGPPVIGYDPEPADMHRVQRDVILQDVLGRLVTASDSEIQPNLWPVDPNWSDSAAAAYDISPYQWTFGTYWSGSYLARNGFNPDGFFASALDHGASTGVLREHAIRLNSSVHCERVPLSDLPSPCPGPRPLEIHVEREGLSLSVCAPGNSSQFPFTPSRHRQDITEDLYVHLAESYESPSYLDNDFTMHCTASTSRGYFELGNEQNHYAYGSLLDRWPEPEDIAANFNDYLGEARPTKEDPGELDVWDLPPSASLGTPFYDDILYGNAEVPGPLMVSAEVLFGNYSFLQFIVGNTTETTPAQAYANICEHGSIPFLLSGLVSTRKYNGRTTGYCYDAAAQARDATNMDRFNDDITHIVAAHASMFNDTDIAEYALTMSMYFANRAVLTQTTLSDFNLQSAGREIYSSSGTITARPTMATASLVVITALVFLQALGLAVLAWFIYSVPTWASALNAMEVARIGRALPDNDLPPLGPVSLKDEKRLMEIDGLVGKVSESDLADKTHGRAAEGSVQLALGGKGLITREVLHNKPEVGDK